MASTYYFVGCNIDHGLTVDDLTEKIQSGIKGTIIFNGAWPDDIIEARLVATADFPPDPADPLQEFKFSDPIPVGVDTFDYAFPLEPDTYRLIGFIAREKGQDLNISNLLAVYSPLDPCTIIPDPAAAVIVESDSSIVEGINISVDLTKGGISGKVEFVGDWSPDITFAGVIVFKFPLNLINPIPCGIAVLPVNVESANYRVLVPENDYLVFVVVGQSLSDITDISDISIIGTASGAIKVLKNQDTPNVDITADLSLFKN
jgi:hypothetical protein